MKNAQQVTLDLEALECIGDIEMPLQEARDGQIATDTFYHSCGGFC